ncbi:MULTISPECIES: glycosyltransferase [Cyanophyceae]|uniref:glycosyltransferase n=1 Tax=Cyanophyceae TaxID=3028117 RepID=UPI00016DC8E2|nr:MULTISPECIES: glycosyltransferase [Cyanophyceae]ACA99501.1 glycosyl transferase, group 1 family protein domain protein [Picosynechococcus sp. PCC 7002]SMH30284.1 Glycosyltransferase involved in cell wall bisynthesis [Picosynechococcus sp. OG1]SMQ83874.1 Glycosyltransferase involved in cell wall bisynthesis [Synechococcus sp. 7002]
MKIWHFTKTIYGGSGQYTLRLSNALKALGHQSEVYVAEGGVPSGVQNLSCVSSSRQNFANRCLVAALRRVSKGPYHSGFRLDSWNIQDDMDSNYPDIVHLHGMTGWIGFDGLRKLIPPNTLVFWTAHDLWMLSGGCVVYQGCNLYQYSCCACPILKGPVSIWSQQEWKHKAKFIQDYKVIPIANSRWVAKKISESSVFSHLHETEIPVVPPIVDSIFLKATSLPSLRDELKIPSHRVVLGLGARSLTDPYKGIPEFIQQLSTDEELSHNCTIILCGDGHVQVPENLDCHFLGALTSSKALAQFYSACDVFISPSRMETFGMTLLESQAAETPVAAFRVGGTPEAVAPQQFQYLAELGQDSNLVNKVKKLLSDKRKNTQIGVKSSEWIRDHFSDIMVAKRQAYLYEKRTMNRNST